MAESKQPDIPDEASEWYSSRRADTLRNVEGQLNQLAEGYSALDNAWNSLNERENIAHDELNTREIVAIQAERQRLQNEAAQVQRGWDALQIEKHKIVQSNDPQFSELLESSSQPAQMFLRTHRQNLEGDANALKRLLHADARCKAVGIKPDSRNYFSALETAVGLDASDRNLDDFDEMRASSNATRREGKDNAARKGEGATEAQKVMARNLPGISEDEYLKACAQPFSQAAQVTVDPDELAFGQGKGMQVSLDETPKQAPVKYKAPDPKSSVTLSPAELALIENIAVQTNTPLAQARKDFAAQKLALHSGKSSHMLYQDRLKAMGQA